MELVHVDKYYDQQNDGFENIFFVSKAALKHDTDTMHHAFKYIYSDGEAIFSTDGKRLHYAKYAMKKGFYKVINKNKSSVLLHYEGDEIKFQFPNCQIVIDSCKRKIKETKAKSIYVYLSYDPKNNSKEHAKIIRYLNENNAYDFCLVNDLRGDFSVCCPGLNEPIFFEQKEIRHALIMPIKL